MSWAALGNYPPPSQPPPPCEAAFRRGEGAKVEVKVSDVAGFAQAAAFRAYLLDEMTRASRSSSKKGALAREKGRLPPPLLLLCYRWKASRKSPPPG